MLKNRFGLETTLFPLTPALSLGERECLSEWQIYSRAFGAFAALGVSTECSSRSSNWRDQLTSARGTILPLPEGEGRGEGEVTSGNQERQILRFAHVPT